jgi:hypothetical protein
VAAAAPSKSASKLNLAKQAKALGAGRGLFPRSIDAGSIQPLIDRTLFDTNICSPHLRRLADLLITFYELGTLAEFWAIQSSHV